MKQTYLYVMTIALGLASAAAVSAQAGEETPGSPSTLPQPGQAPERAPGSDIDMPRSDMPQQQQQQQQRQQPTRDQRMQSRTGDLEKAYRDGIDHAAALEEYASTREDAQLEKSVINDHLQAIGSSLEQIRTATTRLANTTPRESPMSEQVDTMRKQSSKASEHYSTLLEETGKATPKADEVESSAEDLKDALKDAEVAHRKTQQRSE